MGEIHTIREIPLPSERGERTPHSDKLCIPKRMLRAFMFLQAAGPTKRKKRVRKGWSYTCPVPVPKCLIGENTASLQDSEARRREAGNIPPRVAT